MSLRPSPLSLSPAAAVVLASLAAPLLADVSGIVLDASNGSPVAGAQVRFQTTSSPVVTTGAAGTFTLPGGFAGQRVVTASVPYVPGPPPHYNTTGVGGVSDGATGVTISLDRVPTDNATALDVLNQPTADFCGICHTGQYAEWQTANHAGAAQDGWVLDLFSGTGTPGGAAGYVYKNLHDPGETGFCATCHTALADATNPGNVMLDEVTAPVALDGVGCLACHKVDDVNSNVNALHHLGNATYRFPTEVGANTWQFVWGPLADVSTSVMRNAEAPVYGDSRYCASCHQYNNPDTGAPGQHTYTEWQASPYAVPAPGFRSCQDCHMPPAGGHGTLASGGPTRPGSQRHAHTFVGATPATLAAAITLAADGAEVAGQVQVNAHVTNLSGHAFPTGISIRNAMVLVSASYQGTPLVQTSGPTIPFWADDDVPGQQPGDYAGQPGKGFAKVLEGRINGTGPVVRPVLFIDAENVFSDTLIPSVATDHTTVAFALPPGAQPGVKVDVDVRLLYRRTWRALAVTKGWTQTPQGGPVEIEVAHLNFPVELTTSVELQRFEIE